MKTYFRYILSAVAAVLLASCADLDIAPLSELASGNWYTTETEIKMSVDDWYRPDFFQIDEFYWSDDCLYRDRENEITLGTINSQTGFVATRWSNCYKAISRAFGVIKGLESGAATGLSEAKYNQYLGEAWCMIGFSYGQLATYFGDCVLAKSAMTLDESYTATRSPRKEVMAYAFECLDKAAGLLPVSYSGQQRLTKGAALGFKSRFAIQVEDWAVAVDACQRCMELNAYTLHSNYKDLFTATSSKELMFYFQGDLSVPYGVGPFSNVRNFTLRTLGAHTNTGPSYQLYASYLCTDGLPIDESPLYEPKDPFRNRDPRMAYTIQPFKTPYSPDYAEYMAAREDGTFAQKYPDYLFIGLVEYTPNPYITKVFDARKGTLVTTSDTKATQLHSVYTGLPLRKYSKPEWADFASYNLRSDNIYPYLRYAEVLMNYIEAKNELGTVTQDDLDKTINKVRERAYAGTGITYPRVTVASQAALRKIIRMERRMEFAFENTRYRDMLRWKIADKVYNTPSLYLPRVWSGSASWNGKRGAESNCELSADFLKLLDNWDAGNYPFGGIPPIDENGLPDLSAQLASGQIAVFKERFFDPNRNYLWPIPADDILVNPGLGQNPGY